jgi:SAM-dependent methyltransferase
LSRELPRRTVRETYTLRNIKDEIAHRLAGMRRSRPAPPERPVETAVYDDSHARSVGRFYDTHHDAFMRVYGQVIQAFRTKDVRDLLNYQAGSIGFEPGQHALDAGCGVAAPAVYFARHAHVHIDAITISEKQWEAARQRVQDEGLADRVTVVHGDYHRLADHFRKGTYDVVYFLESFGHSRAKAHLLEACWEILKPGGVLYIKDLFRRIPLRPEHAARIDREIRKINEAYRYEVGDLNALLDQARGRGFVLSALKTVDLELEDFEDLAISNEFQELTGMARIDNWDDYIFPVDFFEVKCTKPEFGLEERLDRHFLQNRYHQRAPSSGMK